jgi:hypothetical protein
MPSKTFFNLSPEKQANILSAAKKEFARVPFEQTSFMNIAKDAGVSRSNLYNYFANKQELLSYLLENFKLSILSVIKNSLKKSQGNIFQLFDDIFSYMLEYGFSKENFGLFRSILSNQRFTDQDEMFMTFQQHNECIAELFCYESFQLQHLNINSEDDFQNILEILMGITMKAAIDVYNHPKEKEHFMKRYQDKINLVKYGIVKKEVK